MWPNIFTDDAFSLITLTAVINREQHVPGRVGELAFNGVAEGVATTTVSIEETNETLALVPTTGRGAPATKTSRDKGKIRAVAIPHIALEDTLTASEVEGVRELGTTNQLRTVRSQVEKSLRKMNRNQLDLTFEHMRLGALKGRVLDGAGTEVVDLYDLFGMDEPNSIDFSGVFTGNPDADLLVGVRTYCQRIKRRMKRALKMTMPSTARIWALCGDNFFDALIESTSVRNVFDGYAAAERRLGANYAHGIYEFADVFWENYQGTDDNSTVGIDTDECRFFLTGVPGLYVEYFAPGDFIETVNTIGLPRYAKIAPVDNLNRALTVHLQTNPLPLCTNPGTLIKGTWTPGTGYDYEGLTE